MKGKEFLAYIAPSSIVLLVLMIAPLLMTVFLSLQEFSYGSPLQFRGLQNYAEILRTDQFWTTLGFTLLYTAGTTVGKLAVGFALALLLDHVVRARPFYLGALLVPMIVPPVVGALIFGWMFKPDIGVGFYSYLLSKVGVTVGWFTNLWAARAMLMLQGTWQDAPFAALVLLAGLQVLPREPLEAAMVDGANWWQRLRFVVIPALASLFVFVAMMSVMDAFRVFDNIAVTTKGGPAAGTTSLMWLNYQVAFQQQRLGTGSAISLLTVVAIFILLLPFLEHTRRQMRQA